MSIAIRIVLVTNNEIFCHGLRLMLESVEGMEVVGDCASAEKALFRLGELYPDIVLMDTKMPETNGIKAIHNLKGNPNYFTDVIVLAESPDYRNEALKAGAARCLSNNVTVPELVQTIRQVYRDKELLEGIVELVILPSSNAAQLLRFICQLEELLHGDSTGIISLVGSWNRHSVITVQLEPDRASSLAIKLAGMPEVEKVEELLLAGEGFAKKLLRIRPSKRFSVTLKE